MALAHHERTGTTHFTGFWMNDPVWAKKEGFTATGFLFFGIALLVMLDVVEEDGQAVLRERILTYYLDGDRMIVTPNDDDNVYEQGWELDEDGKLWLEIGTEWVPLVSATLDELDRRGILRYRVEHYMKVARMAGEHFVAPPDAV